MLLVLNAIRYFEGNAMIVISHFVLYYLDANTISREWLRKVIIRACGTLFRDGFMKKNV